MGRAVCARATRERRLPLRDSPRALVQVGLALAEGDLALAERGLAGFFIAAPDGSYGGAAPRNLCDYAKRGGDAALAAAAAGFVNGCGSVGAIGQGFVTYKVVEVCGWEGLFASLAAAMAATAVAVRPALAVEEAAMGGAKASKRVKVA